MINLNHIASEIKILLEGRMKFSLSDRVSTGLHLGNEKEMTSALLLYCTNVGVAALGFKWPLVLTERKYSCQATKYQPTVSFRT